MCTVLVTEVIQFAWYDADINDYMHTMSISIGFIDNTQQNYHQLQSRSIPVSLQAICTIFNGKIYPASIHNYTHKYTSKYPLLSTIQLYPHKIIFTEQQTQLITKLLLSPASIIAIAVILISIPRNMSHME